MLRSVNPPPASDAPRYLLRQDEHGRWYIAHPRYPGAYAWAGWRWAYHLDGVGLVVRISSFDTADQARAYAAAQSHLDECG